MTAPRFAILVRAVLLLLLLNATACRDATDAARRQVIVLGFDGMDPTLCERMLAAGELPNFRRLADAGGFVPLATSTPPQSPVAWSNLITGTDSGAHGIFDFIHRDPATYGPVFSTSITTTSPWMIDIGRWRLPVLSGKVNNLRVGTPFWDLLTEAGIDAHVYRMPANYPPTPRRGPGELLALTDMGTPDLLGSPGEFTFYTSGIYAGSRTPAGGKVERIKVRPIGGDVGRGRFVGPPDGLLNPDKVEQESDRTSSVEFIIFRDRSTQSAVIKWQDQHVLLRAGEWSGWQPVSFSMGPGVAGYHPQNARGLVRLFLRQIDPTIEMYVSPIQVDPSSPAIPISVPSDFAAQVTSSVGPYYTQGLPEDTQALRAGVLSRDEFLAQAEDVYTERMRLLDYALNRYTDGLLFFYFGTTDQVGHMFWSVMAPDHPALTDDDRRRYADVMQKTYRQVDVALGKVIDRFPDATILCISDHGFADFARGFNLNTWLIDNGYARLRDGVTDRSQPMAVDAAASRAYGMGINGLYINTIGREVNGIVPVDGKDALLAEITAGLLAVLDPITEDSVIKTVYRSADIYAPDQLDRGPDLQIGYNRGYRASWSTALGGAPAALLEFNREAWCGDHCIATDLVPGVLFSNRPMKPNAPSLIDIAPTILRAFDASVPDAMTGQDILVH